MVADPKVREAMRKAEAFDGLHPKFSKARILLAETLGINEGERAILFTESRDTAEALVEFLSTSFDVRKFVGQGDKQGSDGMSQKQQQETLQEFKDGEFEVLVSTSVAEEGLDVPEVDLVCFYEPVPTAIRSIQRKGRTGRQAEGKVVVLMAEDTRDEAFFWISRRREKKMTNQLAELKAATDDIEETVGDDGQAGLDAFAGSPVDDGTDATSTTESAAAEEPDRPDSPDSPDDGDSNRATSEGDAGLTDFAAETRSGDEDDDESSEADTGADADGIVATAGVEDGVEIVVDQRELDSSIAKDLSTRDGIVTRLETLAVGDYVLSDRVAVERKSAADFVDSMLDADRSMFEQVGELSRAYARPVMIVEGTNLYGQRDIAPNAIRGALASLAVDFDVSVLRTEDESDTTELLATIAKREQETRDREVSVHGEKTTKTRAEQQEYVVSSIADIGPVTARTLLEHFGSVEGVMTAPEDDLLAVEGVGPVTAERIREVVGSEYE
jgi:Fanconi anemia group M protein